MRKTCSATFVALHGMSALLLAQPIETVSRRSEVGVTIQYRALTDPNPTFATASEQTLLPGAWVSSAQLDVSSAHQSSTTTTSTISGTFEAHANMVGTEFGGSDAHSSMTVIFDLLTSQPVTISGSASTINNAFVPISRGEVRLTGPGTSFSFAAGMNAVDQPIAFSAILQPGQYTFDVLASGRGSVIESAHSTLNVSLVVAPEPGSFCVLIFPLFWRRRN